MTTQTANILFTSDQVTFTAAKGEQRPRISILAYAGGVMNVPGWGPVAVNLDGLDSANVAILCDHRNELAGILGSGVATIRNGALYVDGQLIVASETARQVVELGKGGFPFQASIGAEPIEVKRIQPGDKFTLNGQQLFAGKQGVTVLQKARLREVSVCALGCDAQTSVNIAARKGINMEIESTHDTGENVDAIALRNERDRWEKIGVICKGHSDIEAKAISEGWTVEKAELEVMRASRPTGPAVHSPRDGNPQAVVLEAAFCQSIGLPNLEQHFTEQTLDAAHKSYKGRVRLQSVLMQAASANGYECRPGDRITTGNIADVLSYSLPGRGPQVRAAFSSLSLPGILSNVANKALLQGWMENDQTWRQVATVKPVSDFKQATSYRLTDQLEYEEIGKGGEIPHGTLSEESYTRQARTYAKMYVLTREAIINDDLGAFDDLRTRIGRGAARKFNNVFWAAFIANSTFFTSGNGNYISGSTTNLGTDGVGLEAGVLKFRQMKSSDGKRVDGEPVILLVPPELEFIARKLYTSSAVVSGGGSSATVLPSDNAFFNLYRPVIQPRLSDSGFTGYSTTAWYLLRSPVYGAVACVSFLDGIETPTVDQAEADFNVLGIQFRGFHDFGVDLTVDYPAGIKSKGAA